MCDDIIDPLSLWQRKQKVYVTDQAIADQIGVHQTTISRAKARGALSPDLSDMIQEVTGVSPNQWAEYRRRKREAEKNAARKRAKAQRQCGGGC